MARTGWAAVSRSGVLARSSGCTGSLEMIHPIGRATANSSIQRRSQPKSTPAIRRRTPARKTRELATRCDEWSRTQCSSGDPGAKIGSDEVHFVAPWSSSSAASSGGMAGSVALEAIAQLAAMYPPPETAVTYDALGSTSRSSSTWSAPRQNVADRTPPPEQLIPIWRSFGVHGARTSFSGVGGRWGGGAKRDQTHTTAIVARTTAASASSDELAAGGERRHRPRRVRRCCAVAGDPSFCERDGAGAKAGISSQSNSAAATVATMATPPAIVHECHIAARRVRAGHRDVASTRPRAHVSATRGSSSESA